MSLHMKEVKPPAATETIVFLHGLGVSSWMWDEQITDLQNDYHCLAIDLPGNGESYRTEWVSFTDTVGQLATVIKEQAIGGKAHIVGLSLGGYTALFLLRHHPEVVKSVVVSGVTAKPFTKQWLWRGVFKVMPLISKRDFVIRQTVKMLRLPSEAAELFARDTKRLTALTYKRIYAEVLNLSLPPELAQRSQRLLVVAGDKEVKAAKESLSEFPKIMPHAVTGLVPNAHHAWSGEYPQLFSDMVRAWVSERPLPGEIAVSGGRDLSATR
jgi:pimeloyl-ACP methyl ester carboxylesterase